MKPSSILTVCALLASHASAALVANFAFNGDYSNSGGAAATPVGSQNFVTGKYGQAISLASGLDYVNLNSTTLGGIGTGNFTISLWVQYSGTVVSDPAFLSNKNWDSGANIGINYAIQAAGDLNINTFGGGTGGARNDYNGAETTNLTSGAWANLVLVRRGAELLYYFNGAQETANPIIALAAGVTFANANNFILGDDATTNYNEVSGTTGQNWNSPLLIDDLAVWNEALTPSQITALQTSAAAAIPEPSTVLFGAFGMLTVFRRRRA